MRMKIGYQRQVLSLTRAQAFFAAVSVTDKREEDETVGSHIAKDSTGGLHLFTKAQALIILRKTGVVFGEINGNI